METVESNKGTRQNTLLIEALRIKKHEIHL